MRFEPCTDPDTPIRLFGAAFLANLIAVAKDFEQDLPGAPPNSAYLSGAMMMLRLLGDLRKHADERGEPWVFDKLMDNCEEYAVEMRKRQEEAGQGEKANG